MSGEIRRCSRCGRRASERVNYIAFSHEVTGELTRVERDECGDATHDLADLAPKAFELLERSDDPRIESEVAALLTLAKNAGKS